MGKDQISIQFLGGAGTVTGSKTLVRYGDFSVLIDCGLFQGLKELREMNWVDLPFDHKELDAVILTHAHLDHCGHLPVLFRNGYSGPVHCTYPTEKLTEIILMDSAKIQEEDAARANKYHYSHHTPAKPLYTRDHVRYVLPNIVSHNYHEWVILKPGIKFQLLNAGHILGSAMVELKIGDKTLLFTGDLGRKDPMLMYPPAKVEQADYIIMESTYGDRTHRVEDVKTKLRDVIRETYDRKGMLMIPSFAVERTQEIIYLLYLLKEEDEIPNIPVFLDSPMGVNSTMVFTDYPEEQDISRLVSRHMYDFVQFISDVKQSHAIVEDKNPKIVLAGSGMLEGGRILHYLNNHMENSNNTILFVGFQAVGTRGRTLVQGGREIKFFGEYHQVNCKVESISSMSAHADCHEMVDWLKNFKSAPEKIFLNHGEPHQTEAFRVMIESKLGFNVAVPTLNQKFTLED